MKKILALVGLLSVVGTQAFAAAHYGTAGCGLGSMVFTDKGQVSQIVASLLNFTGFQSVAITFGTSNCDTPSASKRANMEQFIEANMVAINNDIAKGKGETIASISSVYGCNDSAKVGSTLQKNYKAIFPSKTSNAKEVSDQLEYVMKEKLNTTCTAWAK